MQGPIQDFEVPLSSDVWHAKDALSKQIRAQYEKRGFFIIKEFFDFTTEFLPIHEIINVLIDEKLDELGLTPIEPDLQKIRQKDFAQIANRDRARAGQIYRACRHLLPLHRLSSSDKLTALAGHLMQTAHINYLPYTAVRIDIPGEEKYLFRWHQDYPYTQGSVDGIVVWAPLFNVALGEGSLRVIPESHKEGVHKVRLVDPENRNKNGAHTIAIPDQQKFEQRNHVDVSLEAGDALVFSTLLLHRSTPSGNSQKVRWTIQLRYANFSNQDAVARGWPGGMIEGEGFEEHHPELLASSGARPGDHRR